MLVGKQSSVLIKQQYILRGHGLFTCISRDIVYSTRLSTWTGVQLVQLTWTLDSKVTRRGIKSTFAGCYSTRNKNFQNFFDWKLVQPDKTEMPSFIAKYQLCSIWTSRRLLTCMKNCIFRELFDDNITLFMYVMNWTYQAKLEKIPFYFDFKTSKMLQQSKSAKHFFPSKWSKTYVNICFEYSNSF